MKPTQAAFAAILLLVASGCATKHSQSRDPSGTAQVKQGAPANKAAQAKKDDQLICEWTDPDTGSHLAQKVCHYPNEVTPESEDPQAPPGGFVPSRPTIQLGGGG